VSAPVGAGTVTTVVTPTVRQAGRRARYWIVAGILAILVALGSILLTGALGPPGRDLSPTNAAPAGSKAIAAVLRSQGMTVTATDSMAATRAAAGDPADTTIFVVDDGGYLGGDQLRDLARLSADLVLMTPGYDQLDAIAPEVSLGGAVDGTLEADCELSPVRRADTVTGTGSGFRLLAAGADAVECLASGDDIHSLIQLTRGEKRLTILGTREAFSNQAVSEEGNAALALGLLGRHGTLVWMLPSIDEAAAPGATPDPGSPGSPGAPGEPGTPVDTGGAGNPLGPLTPPWLSAVMVLLILTVVAAAFWRGRRLGPLVVENLPVTVRASETMEGRARLYQGSSARLHALDALRMGSIDRLGRLCGLPRLASVDEVIRAVATATGRPPAEVAGILRDDDPASERDLIRLSDAVRALEDAAAEALRPSSARTRETMPPTDPGE
jgi:hypothetical protein